jgi:phosphoesterase, MJ0936 family
MITFSQSVHGLLGTDEAVTTLAEKQNGRVLVISDSHGQKDLFRHIVGQIGPSCDALVFCGDGAGDFAACMNYAAENVPFSRCVPGVAAFVQGNGDPERLHVSFNTSKKDVQPCFELFFPRRQILSAAGSMLYIVHGDEQGAYYGTAALEEEGKTAGADVVLYGHTHIADEALGELYVVNPGSPAHPRGGTPPSFAVLEISGGQCSSVFYRIENGLKGMEFIPFFPKKTYL